MHRCQATFVYRFEAFGVADDDAYRSCLDWWSHECQSQVWSIRSTFCKSECAGELYFHFQSNISDNIHWCGLKSVVDTEYTLCSICEGERNDCNLQFIGCNGSMAHGGQCWLLQTCHSCTTLMYSPVALFACPPFCILFLLISVGIFVAAYKWATLFTRNVPFWLQGW